MEKSGSPERIETQHETDPEPKLLESTRPATKKFILARRVGCESNRVTRPDAGLLLRMARPGEWATRCRLAAPLGVRTERGALRKGVVLPSLLMRRTVTDTVAFITTTSTQPLNK